MVYQYRIRLRFDTEIKRYFECFPQRPCIRPYPRIPKHGSPSEGLSDYQNPYKPVGKDTKMKDFRILSISYLHLGVEEKLNWNPIFCPLSPNEVYIIIQSV